MSTELDQRIGNGQYNVDDTVTENVEDVVENVEAIDLRELPYDGRQIVCENGYQTIQDAWNAASDGDMVVVTGEYDPSEEDFPIVFDYREKEVSISGNHSRTEIDASHQNEHILEVIGVGVGDFRNVPLIQNLKLVGGRNAVRARGAPNAKFYNLVAFLQDGHGFVVDHYDGRGAQGTRFVNCQAWTCGGSGWHFTHDAQAHGSLLFGCNATWNGYNGTLPGMTIRGFSTRVLASTIQVNSGTGIVADFGGSITVKDCYMEANGREADHAVNVRFEGVSGGVIESNYLNAATYGSSGRQTNARNRSALHVGVELHNTYRCQFRANVLGRRLYQDGVVAITGSSSLDNDVYESTHHYTGRSGGMPNFWARDRGTRTRSHGIIRPGSLSGVEGMYEGDRAIDANGTLRVWMNGSWN